MSLAMILIPISTIWTKHPSTEPCNHPRQIQLGYLNWPYFVLNSTWYTWEGHVAFVSIQVLKKNYHFGQQMLVAQVSNHASGAWSKWWELRWVQVRMRPSSTLQLVSTQFSEPCDRAHATEWPQVSQSVSFIILGLLSSYQQWRPSPVNPP